MEESIIFKNRNGFKLHGIVHIPQKSDSRDRIGINLLNPGIKYRVAPNRLNVKIARHLCDMGYYVLRFDPEGVGDSDGELPSDVLVPDIWEDIQKGRFINDTVKSNDVFTERYGLDHLIVGGTCGGAITALMASKVDCRVDGLFLIDIPVNLRQPGMKFADKIDDRGKKLDYYFKEYTKRITVAQSWKRFITFKSDYGSIIKIFRLKILSLLKNSKETELYEDIERLCKINKLNVYFFGCFESFIKKKNPIIFILAGNDSGTEIFKRFFEKGFLDKIKRDNLNFEELIQIKYIENANHIYSAIEWQEKLKCYITLWIEKEFPLLELESR